MYPVVQIANTKRPLLFWDRSSCIVCGAERNWVLGGVSIADGKTVWIFFEIGLSGLEAGFEERHILLLIHREIRHRIGLARNRGRELVKADYSGETEHCWFGQRKLPYQALALDGEALERVKYSSNFISRRLALINLDFGWRSCCVMIWKIRTKV
jgi:hypothetical protein